MSINHKIITLENNEKYFVISEIIDNDKNYSLNLNINDENDIKIMEEIKNSEDISLVEVSDENLKKELSNRFMEDIKKVQQQYI